MKMNYTKFTTDKPVHEQTGAATFGSVRDIAYLVFSILQFGISVFTMVLVYYFIRRKDKKDERERLEKEERDKIADIINNEYNKIVEDGIVENLRKCKAKFQAIVMFYGSVWETRGRKLYTITGLDVLRFMLLNPDIFKSEPLTKLQQDISAVVRLFQSLRIKLPLKGDCPINIKEELGPLISDVGEITRSFVSARKRYTISNVLKYFGNVQVVRSIRNEEKEDDENNRKIKRILPYINNLSLGKTSKELPLSKSKIPLSYHDEDISCDIYIPIRNRELHAINSELRDIKNYLCSLSRKTIKIEDLRRFTGKIDAIWRREFQELLDTPIPDWNKEEYLRANTLHVVWVFMFKVAEGSDVIHDEEFKELVSDMWNKAYKVQDSDYQKIRSMRAIEDLQRAIKHLTSGELALLCEQISIADVLERVSKDIDNSIAQALRTNKNI